MQALTSPWLIRGRELDVSARALVMGVVNVTPDSFSDGGQFLDAARAIAHALELIKQGADILDIGGESSRPGATPVSVEEELARVLPVVEALARDTGAVLSIDTVKAEVAERTLAAGAHIINDITALTGDAGMAEVVRRHEAGLILMHMRGTPLTMQEMAEYGDVVGEVAAYLQARLQAAAEVGIDVRRVAVDPGIGFAKTAAHNLDLVRRLDVIAAQGRPVVLGASRKGFLGEITGRPRHERDAATHACHGFALAAGTAHVVRVHDAAGAADAVRVMAAIGQAATTSWCPETPPDPRRE
jgi:dihydropteroate synthase